MSSIFNVFSKAPFGLLREHIAKSLYAAELLESYFAAVFVEDWEKAAAVKKQIAEQETLADEIKKKVYVRLHSDLLMPVSRHDVLALVQLADGFANQAKDITGISYGRRLVIPTDLQPDFSDLLKSAIASCVQARQIVDELDAVLKSGLTGGNRALLEGMVEKLDHLENENDGHQVLLRQSLWGQEKKMMPVDVVFLYKIFDLIGNLADSAHRVGARLLLFVPPMK